MKPLSAFITLLASSVGLTLWAQLKPSTANTPAAALTPGSAENPTPVDNEEQAANKSAALGEFLHSSNYSHNLAGIAAASRDAAGPVSVLCFKDPDQKALSETTEDLAVLSFLLSRDLEQAFADERNEYKLGIPMLLTSGKQSVGASYIQGFGVILKMQVRFPLVGSSEAASEVPAAKPDSEWEEARREMLADENGGTTLWDSQNQPDAGHVRKLDGKRYDAKLVQTLKRRVLVLLKNAANLRHVEGDEWIIVKIVGAPYSPKRVKAAAAKEQSNEVALKSEPRDGGSATAEESAAADQTASASSGKRTRRHSGSGRSVSTTVENAQTSSRPTIMTLRVRKSAADAFLAGTLTEDQFINQAEAAAYLNPLPPNPRSTAFSDVTTY
jgi:hypothetical protein